MTRVLVAWAVAICWTLVPAYAAGATAASTGPEDEAARPELERDARTRAADDVLRPIPGEEQAAREAIARDARTRAVDDMLTVRPVTPQEALALTRPAAHPGRQEFESRCARCHGAAGRGDGAEGRLRDTSPADLTTLSRAHGGTFPYLHFVSVVDGRLRGFGEMPAFAVAYGAEAPGDAERYVAQRIAVLADYVAALQVR